MVRKILRVVWRVFSIFCVVIVIIGTGYIFFSGEYKVIFKGLGQPPVISLDSEAFESLPEPVQQASQTVVSVQVEGYAKKPRFTIHAFQWPGGGGSGVIISPHYVLTAFHVVKSAFGVSAKEYLPMIVTVAHEGVRHIATPVAFDATFDLALLRVEGKLSVYAEIVSNDMFYKSWDNHKDFYVAGDPPSYCSPSEGYIYEGHYNFTNPRHVPSFGKTFFMVKVEDPDFRGFSGGAVLNPKGEVVGIVSLVRRTLGRWQLCGTSAPLIQEFLKVALSQ